MMQQIVELEDSKSMKTSSLIISLPWWEFMPPNPDNSVLEIFDQIEFGERKFGIGTPSPSPTSTHAPLLYSNNLSQCNNEDIQENEEKELRHEKVESCGRGTCLRCNSGVDSKVFGAEFPAPISSIGRNGKPRVYYQSIKEKGRLVLKEIRIPSQRCMHAFREDGRLLLQLGSPKSFDG
jgi:Fantastic Four meristem regulator